MQVINTLNHYLVKFIFFQGYTRGRRQPCQVHGHSKQLFAGHLCDACAATSDIFVIKTMTCARCRNQNNPFDLLFAVVVRN